MRRAALTILVLSLLGTIPARSQKSGTDKHSPLEIDSILKQGPEHDLLKTLTGSWTVQQTIFLKDNKGIMTRDTFSVERKMVGNFLQEIMLPSNKAGGISFTRIAYLNYNRTNLRWEYVVLDTRYPIMMFETSVDHRIPKDKSIHVYLDNFVFPPFWGMEFAGMLGKQSRILTFGKNEDSNRQYWTLPGGKEFLAIEYRYSRK